MKYSVLIPILLLASQAFAAEENFGEAREWKKAGFGNPEFRVLKTPSSLDGRSFTHSLKVLFVMFRQAGWAAEDVQKQFDWSANSYAQCGIKFADSPLVIVDAPGGKVTIDPNLDEADDGNIARRIPTAYRPAVVLVKKNHSFPSGYSYNHVNPPREEALIGTAYVDSIVLHSIIKLKYYNVIAHELAHILGNAGHNENDPPDILSAPFPHADYISPEQCETMRDYPSVMPLR